MAGESESIKQIELEKLDSFQDHPFLVRDDEQMQTLADSIRSVGVLVPTIVRPKEKGRYEIIAGHRRKHGCELAGLSTLPCVVREVDRDDAVVMMVDSNFQRERILPSERGRAYKMKLNAIKRQGERTDLTSAQSGQKWPRKTARDRIADDSPDSSSQIQRYIRLTELRPELLQMVDEGRIALTPAAEISYLTHKEQALLLLTMESEQATPSLSQAQRMKKLSRQGMLTVDEILSIMTERKKPECWNLNLSMDQIAEYFPPSYTPKMMEETIFKLLNAWMRQRIKRGNG